MKVLNLRCENGHGFEGWFGSEDEFVAQQQRNLIECPVCASALVQKLPSAPRLNLGARATQGLDLQAGAQEAHSRPVPAVVPNVPNHSLPNPAELASVAHMEAAFLDMVRQVMDKTEDVGRRFAQEARRMHHGDVDARAIRGQASLSEVKDLMEEGIDVLPLPIPEALKNKPH
jgi:hypothetical protein